MTRKAGLNSNTLKLLAVVAMICQHVTIFFIPTTNPWYYPLFCFGMITAPIMCFFIAEGYYHTHSRRKYLERLLLGAVISHVPHALASRWGMFLVDFGVHVALFFVVQTNGTLWTRFAVLAAIPLLLLYNGQRGRKSKWYQWGIT